MNKDELTRILPELKEKLEAGEQSTNDLINTVRKLGERVATLERATRFSPLSVPSELETLLIEVKHVNDRHRACRTVLQRIDEIINGDFEREIAQIETAYQNEIGYLNIHFGSQR